MSKRARRNYIRATSQLVNRKKMYKAKKQWVVAGMSFLIAMGVGISINTSVHASVSPTSQIHTSVQAKLNNNGNQIHNSNDVQKQASNLHNKIMANNTQSASANNSSVANHKSVQSASSTNSASNSVKSVAPSSVNSISASSTVNSAKPLMKVASSVPKFIASVSASNNSVTSKSVTLSSASISNVSKVAKSAVKPLASSSTNSIASSNVKASVSSTGVSAKNNNSNQVSNKTTKRGLMKVGLTESPVNYGQQIQSADNYAKAEIARYDNVEGINGVNSASAENYANQISAMDNTTGFTSANATTATSLVNNISSIFSSEASNASQAGASTQSAHHTIYPVINVTNDDELYGALWNANVHHINVINNMNFWDMPYMSANYSGAQNQYQYIPTRNLTVNGLNKDGSRNTVDFINYDFDMNNDDTNSSINEVIKNLRMYGNSFIGPFNINETNYFSATQTFDNIDFVGSRLLCNTSSNTHPIFAGKIRVNLGAYAPEGKTLNGKPITHYDYDSGGLSPVPYANEKEDIESNTFSRRYFHTNWCIGYANNVNGIVYPNANYGNRIANGIDDSTDMPIIRTDGNPIIFKSGSTFNGYTSNGNGISANYGAGVILQPGAYVHITPRGNQGEDANEGMETIPVGININGSGNLMVGKNAKLLITPTDQTDPYNSAMNMYNNYYPGAIYIDGVGAMDIAPTGTVDIKYPTHDYHGIGMRSLPGSETLDGNTVGAVDISNSASVNVKPGATLIVNGGNPSNKSGAQGNLVDSGGNSRVHISPDSIVKLMVGGAQAVNLFKAPNGTIIPINSPTEFSLDTNNNRNPNTQLATLGVGLESLNTKVYDQSGKSFGEYKRVVFPSEISSLTNQNPNRSRIIEQIDNLWTPLVNVIKNDANISAAANTVQTNKDTVIHRIISIYPYAINPLNVQSVSGSYTFNHSIDIPRTILSVLSGQIKMALGHSLTEPDINTILTNPAVHDENYKTDAPMTYDGQTMYIHPNCFNLQHGFTLTRLGKVPYSDIYGASDTLGNTVPQATTNPKSTDLGSDWAYVDKNGVESNTPIENAQGHIMIAPKYRGLVYHYNKNNKSLEFTNGTADSELRDFIDGEPSNIQSATSIKFDNDVNTSNVTDMSSMFRGDRALKSLDLGNNFDTSNVTNMADMFNNDLSLRSLNLGDKFSTSKVSDMREMFSADIYLQSLSLGNHFNTSNVTNMNAMFGADDDLHSLNLGNEFDTSKVSDMSQMFDNDWNLESLNLGDKFNTSKVTNMYQMFAPDNNLHSLTIQSPNTKLHSSDDLHSMYQQLPDTDMNGNHYTFTKPNDFSKGNVGTFITPANPKVTFARIKFINKNTHKMMGASIARGYVGSSDTVTTLPRKLNNKFQIANDGTQKFIFGNKNENINVNVLPKTVKQTDTDSVHFIDTSDSNNDEGWIKVTGNNESDYTVKNSQLPHDYQLANNGTQTFKLDNGIHNVDIVNIDHNTHTHLPEPVNGSKVSTTATIHLVYKESNGTVDSQGVDSSKPNYDPNDVKKINVNGLVGNNKTYWAIFYGKSGYQLNMSKWTINLQAGMKPQSHTFTFVGKSAGAVEVEYIDVDPQSAKYNQSVGTQKLGDLGTVNTSVDLGAIGDNDPSINIADGHKTYDLLQAPLGFALVNHFNPITIHLNSTRLNKIVLALGNPNPVAKSTNSQANNKAKVASLDSSIANSYAHSADASIANSYSNSVKNSVNAMNESMATSEKNSVANSVKNIDAKLAKQGADKADASIANREKASVANSVASNNKAMASSAMNSADKSISNSYAHSIKASVASANSSKANSAMKSANNSIANSYKTSVADSVSTANSKLASHDASLADSSIISSENQSLATSADSSIATSYKNSVQASVKAMDDSVAQSTQASADKSIASSYSNSIHNSVASVDASIASSTANSANNSIEASYKGSINNSVEAKDNSIKNSEIASVSNSVSAMDSSIANSFAKSADASIATSYSKSASNSVKALDKSIASSTATSADNKIKASIAQSKSASSAKTSVVQPSAVDTNDVNYVAPVATPASASEPDAESNHNNSNQVQLHHSDSAHIKHAIIPHVTKLNQIKKGSKAIYHGLLIERNHMRRHYDLKHYVHIYGDIKLSHKPHTTKAHKIHVLRAFTIIGKHGKYVRLQVRVGHRTYFITGKALKKHLIRKHFHKLIKHMHHSHIINQLGHNK